MWLLYFFDLLLSQPFIGTSLNRKLYLPVKKYSKNQERSILRLIIISHTRKTAKVIFCTIGR